MPGLDFTLPHWAYWIGLIVFPAVAMILARRTKAGHTGYSIGLAYGIWLVGGMLGLHRFYLRSLLGLVYLPVFLLILYANSESVGARNEMSDTRNQLRVAERTIDREGPRVDEARAEMADLQAAVEEAEEGSVAARLAQRRLERAERTIERSADRLEEARADVDALRTARDDAVAGFRQWNTTARYAFYAILALMAVDLFLIPGLVRRANASISDEEIAHEEEAARAAAETARVTKTRSDASYAENWVDHLCLRAGEFVSYWAVIAVFVYYYEVIARYVFGSPTNWAHESMYLMFGMQYLIAGAYAMLTEAHVRVDIFYAPLPKQKKAWTDLVTSIFFFIFAGTLLVTSWIFAMDALAVPTGNSVVSQWARDDLTFYQMLGQFTISQWSDPNIRWGEISFNEWEVPLWPMKWVMVTGAVLLLLQGFSKIAKDIQTLRRGDPPPEREPDFGAEAAR